MNESHNESRSESHTESQNEKQDMNFFSQLESKFAEKIIASNQIASNEIEIRIAAENLIDVVTTLKEDEGLDFDIMINVTAVDYMDSNFMSRPVTDRFDLVYNFLSIGKLNRLRIKVAVSETQAEVQTLTGLYESANFMEREVWDMYGIKFKDHPDLRRILMYDEFEGHPLRKDYPVQGKQPRVPMRHPEVSNTARLMQRPELVQIKKSTPRAS